jgi:hypothetical protein
VPFARRRKLPGPGGGNRSGWGSQGAGETDWALMGFSRRLHLGFKKHLAYCTESQSRYLAQPHAKAHCCAAMTIPAHSVNPLKIQKISHPNAPERHPLRKERLRPSTRPLMQEDTLMPRKGTATTSANQPFHALSRAGNGGCPSLRANPSPPSKNAILRNEPHASPQPQLRPVLARKPQTRNRKNPAHRSSARPPPQSTPTRLQHPHCTPLPLMTIPSPQSRPRLICP